MTSPPIRWAVGLTTAPRPEPTLQQTLHSLQAAGWPDCRLFDDAKRAGAWPNWIAGLRTLLAEYPNAEAYMLVQDDAIFCRRLRRYLEKTLWPASNLALCSPYCPAPYRKSEHGWHQQDRGWNLVGAVCWVIPPHSARSIIADLAHVQARNRIDARIGQWAKNVGRSVWYHTPSLVQHIGSGNSALGDPLINSLRKAADFIGEDTLPDL